MTGLLFQGVRQDHQAALHGAIQPVHPERGRPQRHSQHQQRGGGAAARAGHHRRRPVPAEQADGRLTALRSAEFIHFQSVGARPVVPERRLMYRPSSVQ